MRTFFTIGLMLGIGFANSALADWTLQNDQSRLSYVTVKKAEIAEPNQFETLSGVISENGSAEIVIDLTSVETWIDSRNERMGKFLFEIEDFPKAFARAKLDMAALDTLGVGQRREMDMEFQFDFHGFIKTVEASVFVTRVAVNRVTVSNSAPVIIDGDDYGLTAGLTKLQELAKLPSITPQVAVGFDLMFEKN